MGEAAAKGGREPGKRGSLDVFSISLRPHEVLREQAKGVSQELQAFIDEFEDCIEV